MNQTAEYFEKNSYVVLKDALDHNECKRLVDHLFELKKQNKTVTDDQCPLSDAVYGDIEFDQLLEKFCQPLSGIIGKKLLPTYSYARIYRPGEVLKKHKDRPACEISATLTLGYDAKNVWPIFFDENKEVPVDLQIGEMAVYKGCDILHWRTAFKGKWHVQVFLHYVDANGPYKDHVLDGRKNLGIQKTKNLVTPNSKLKNQQNNQKVSNQSKQEIFVSKPILNGVIIPGKDKFFPGYFCIDKSNAPELMFTKEECEKIISLTDDLYPSSASIGGTKDSSQIRRDIRSATIYVIENDPKNHWLFEKISDVVNLVNMTHFDYEISGITHGMQLIHYTMDEQDVPGHYDWHTDSGNGDTSCRKISLSVQLSDPKEYEGCELIINNHGDIVVGPKDQGSIHLFPSYMTHQVTPVKSGSRYSLVIWVHGSRRFR